MFANEKGESAGMGMMLWEGMLGWKSSPSALVELSWFTW